MCSVESLGKTAAGVRLRGDEELRLHHIGIAVNNLPEAVEVYRQILNIRKEQRLEVPSEKIRTSLLWLEEGMIELMEPQEDAGPVAHFLKSRGPGLHHIAVTVDYLDRALAELRSRGFEVVPPTVRIGVLRDRVAFIHPRSAKGVLVELCEHPRRAAKRRGLRLTGKGGPPSHYRSSPDSETETLTR